MSAANRDRELIGEGRRVILVGARGSSMSERPVFYLEYGPDLHGWRWADDDSDVAVSPSGNRYRYTHHESGTGGDGVSFGKGALHPEPATTTREAAASA